jgi:hypothetical protein
MNTDAVNYPQRQGLLFNCERCGQPIEVAAALLFSSPDKDMVRKHHLCSDGYQAIVQEFSAHKTIGPA